MLRMCPEIKSSTNTRRVKTHPFHTRIHLRTATGATITVTIPASSSIIRCAASVVCCFDRRALAL